MDSRPITTPDEFVVRGRTWQFRHCTALAVTGAAISLAPVVVSVWMALVLLDGHGVSAGVIVLTLPVPLTIMIVVFALHLWNLVRHQSWVRLSDTGIELADGGDPVMIAWSQIADACIRRRSVFAVLRVIPVSLDAVVTIDGGGHEVPPVHYDNGTAYLQIPIGLLRPGPTALRAALTNHLPTPPHG